MQSHHINDCRLFFLQYFKVRSFFIASLTCALRSLPFLALNFSGTYISLICWCLCNSCSDVTKLINIFSHFSFLSLNWNLDHPWTCISLQVSKGCSIWNYPHMFNLAGEIRHCSCWNTLCCFLLCLAFRYTSLMLRGLSPYSLSTHMHPDHSLLFTEGSGIDAIMFIFHKFAINVMKTTYVIPWLLRSLILDSATPLLFHLSILLPWFHFEAYFMWQLIIVAFQNQKLLLWPQLSELSFHINYDTTTLYVSIQSL